eukprot:12924782-Prorocentrum_lima.AAC.1
MALAGRCVLRMSEAAQPCRAAQPATDSWGSIASASIAAGSSSVITESAASFFLLCTSEASLWR